MNFFTHCVRHFIHSSATPINQFCAAGVFSFPLMQPPLPQKILIIQP
jgi:hypothetical protein